MRTSEADGVLGLRWGLGTQNKTGGSAAEIAGCVSVIAVVAGRDDPTGEGWRHPVVVDPRVALGHADTCCGGTSRDVMKEPKRRAWP